MLAAKDKRKSLLAQVHIASKELGLTEKTYRQYLWRWFGVASSSELNESQLERLVEIYKLNGWKPKPGKEAREERRAKNRASFAQMGMIRGIWKELERAGKLRNPTDDALCAFIKTRTGIDRPEWLTIRQAGSVIDGLKAWRERT